MMKLFEVIGEALPLYLAGLLFIAMAVSVLFRYSQRFRDFWEEHICGWMEEQSHRCQDPGERSKS